MGLMEVSGWTKRKREKAVASTTPIYGRITERSYLGPWYHQN